eukprot:3896204-Pyramimonas_sp.AAC.1
MEPIGCLLGSRGRPLGSLLEGVWRPSLGRFGASWDLFWASWGHLGASWGPHGADGSDFRFVFPLLGRLWCRFVAFLGCLRRLLGRFGALLGRPGPFLETSWAVLGWSWGPPGPSSWSVGKPQRRERQNLSKTLGKAVIFVSWGPVGRPPGGPLGASWRLLGPQ